MSTIIAGRKVRADAKLEQLNEAQRERLHVLFEENWAYSEVIRLIRAEFGISVGRSAVSAYYRRHVLSVQQQDDAEVVAALVELPVADFDKATLQRVKALLWSAIACINPDVDLAAKLSVIVDKAERRALAVRKLVLEERKVAVKEKLAAVRIAAEERRSAKAELGTTKHTKGHEKGGESAGGAGRSEGAEIAAKAQSSEGRSKGAEAANLVSERQNLPRFSGYSEVVRAEDETETARELRESARIQRQNEEPRNTRNDTKELTPERVKEADGHAGKRGAVEGAVGSTEARAREGSARLSGEGELLATAVVRQRAAGAPPVLASKAAREAAVAEAIGRKEILRGMTPKQVVMAWGQPHGTAAMLSDYRRYDVWTYRFAAGEKQVRFDGDAVLSCTDVPEEEPKPAVEVLG